MSDPCHYRNSRLVACLLFSFAFAPAVASEQRGDSEHDWFFEDFETQTANVNEGELEFIHGHADGTPHRHINRIRIDDTSLQSGWVALDQCHENLDAAAAVQIVFNPQRTRRLEITQYKNIGAAVVQGSSVQLKHVGRHARLCVRLESRALHSAGNNSYLLKNGPYMRQFLDGYYPLKVELAVSYPCKKLQFEHSRPDRQPGFEVIDSDCSVRIVTTFEGRLFTELQFKSR